MELWLVWFCIVVTTDMFFHIPSEFKHLICGCVGWWTFQKRSFSFSIYGKLFFMYFVLSICPFVCLSHFDVFAFLNRWHTCVGKLVICSHGLWTIMYKLPDMMCANKPKCIATITAAHYNIWMVAKINRLCQWISDLSFLLHLIASLLPPVHCTVVQTLILAAHSEGGFYKDTHLYAKVGPIFTNV